jgi:hypothetical protein
VLDDTNTYPVSNAYGLTNVPTTFWIGQDGEIEISSVGWDRSDFEQINAKMAETTRRGVVPIFQPERMWLRFGLVEGLRISLQVAGFKS